ncbi:hypothetical protein C0995_005889 [Termitomyces sp. Mi166|nr:hypothetical protein C0995_005889 [Termitomyces sp. Mi166\
MGTTGYYGKDAIAIIIANGENMIFDHVSVSWGRDKTFSINGDVSNVTIFNSIIAQGLQTHSCGGLIQTDGGVKGVNEFVNIVVYNWGVGGGYIAGDSDGQSYANILNNVFISVGVDMNGSAANAWALLTVVYDARSDLGLLHAEEELNAIKYTDGTSIEAHFKAMRTVWVKANDQGAGIDNRRFWLYIIKSMPKTVEQGPVMGGAE